jgi:hypothetical protein
MESVIIRLIFFYFPNQLVTRSKLAFFMPLFSILTKLSLLKTSLIQIVLNNITFIFLALGVMQKTFFIWKFFQMKDLDFSRETAENWLLGCSKSLVWKTEGKSS